jgi:hypothetical protein
MYMQNSAKNAEAVVTDTAFSYPCVGIYVGASGDVSVVMDGGATVVFVGVLAGSLLPVRASMVTTANTTASSMLALFN